MFWQILWKIVFITTLTGFGLMAIWVTVQGARDVVALLATLRREHDEGASENM